MPYGLNRIKHFLSRMVLFVAELFLLLAEFKFFFIIRDLKQFKVKISVLPGVKLQFSSAELNISYT